MIPLGATSVRCEGYDMECIDRIQELRACVRAMLFPNLLAA